MPKKAAKVKITHAIRNELRMLCALRGYSNLKCGKGKTLVQQHDALYAYYHGQPPSRPSQIKMLCEGNYLYRDLYDAKQKISTSKKDTEASTTELVLKKTLHCDTNRVYRATKEITYSDLERISHHLLHPLRNYHIKL